MTELIGEEIYDEFDPHSQGAQLSSFIPPDADSGTTVAVLNAKKIIPNNQDGLLPTAGHDAHNSAGSGPMIVKPIALKAMEGFGALINRSRSAPPTPMEQVGKRPPSKSSALPKSEGRNENECNVPPVDGTAEKISVPDPDLPNPHPMTQMTISDADPQLPHSQPQTPKLDSTVPHTSHLTHVTPPRIASPGSLEAYLIERKRRGVSGSSAIPRIVTPTPGVKGKGFKSSPLGPIERDTTDGVKSKDTDEVTREGDGRAPPPETVMDVDKLN